MTRPMLNAALNLLEAANEYRRVYERDIKKDAVIYLDVTDESHRDFGKCIFLTDSFNTSLIKSHLKIK